MMKTGLSMLSAVLLLVFLSACQRRENNLGEQRGQFVALDSSQAAQHIASDPEEGFFERVNAVDMGLQLRQCFPDSLLRRDILPRYRLALRRDVSSFSEEEAALLLAQLRIIRQWAVDFGAADLFPDTLKLIKSRGSLYGEGAFFTRGKAIIVPEDALQRPNRQELRRTLLHELFHIYSRRHPKKREALYSILGFEPLNAAVRLPDSIAGQVLLNPDGLADHFAVKLENGADSVLAYPLLRARPDCYREDQPGFFAYIDFQLYPLTLTPDGEYTLALDAAGNSPITYYELPGFFDRIGDNTSYIIHPDEILADNLALLFLRAYEPEQLAETVFSARGEQILKDMRAIITR